MIHRFSAADLPIVDGKVYHLDIKPDQLAQNVILVGDPDRVPVLAKNCLVGAYVVDANHRGLRTITGKTARGLPVSIVTSGMGTPSTEIVLNELIFLNEIDLETRTLRESPLHKQLNIIRFGTSGGLQASTELGTPIISVYAVGFDNTGLFYDSPANGNDVVRLEVLCENKINEVMAGLSSAPRFLHKIYPYAAKASPEIAQALCQAATESRSPFKSGITATNSGFFANQGRDVVGIRLTVPNIDGILSELSFEGLKIENMEQEVSFLLYFAEALNQRKQHSGRYRAGAICSTIANRRLDTFDACSEENFLKILGIILKTFEKLSR